METKVYKPIIKEFLKQDVRVIKVDDYHEYVVCKDMFDILGLVKSDGGWDKAKKKMFEILDMFDIRPASQKLRVSLKDKQSKNGQIRELTCLNIEKVSLVLTQFKPINSNRRTKEQNAKALETWIDLMKFFGVLLEMHETSKYVFKTKDIQKEYTDELYKNSGNPKRMNMDVNKIMGVVLQMEDGKPVKKSEIYQFQNRITEDVGRVRDEILKTYVTMFKVTEDKDKTYELTLEWSKKKYLK